MATLTSTGAVNLTSSTNWSPAQIPATGDDLIIGAHTLTLDADMTLNSVTFNNTSSRLAISGTTRSVEATNGWIMAAHVASNLITASIPTGTSLTLTGTWSGNFSITGIASSTGGNLTLQTVGADTSAVLFSDTGANNRVIASSWSGGTLTTIGFFDLPSWTSVNTIVSISAGTWIHQSSGVNRFGVGGHRLVSCSSTGTVQWTGSVVSQGTVNVSALITLSSSSTTHSIGQAGDYFSLTGVAAFGYTAFLQVSSGTVELVGDWYCTNAQTFYQTGGTINWRNQSATIPSGKILSIYCQNSTLNFSGLAITNNGSVGIQTVGSQSITVDSGTSITCTSTSAFASSVGVSTSLNSKIITLESDPPTLPAVEDVASGTIYGYTGIELTGTGLILDPAVLATAVGSSLENISATALARWATVDTGETAAADGSVAKLSQGGSGGGTDWTAGEREQIRHRLGIDGTATAPTSGTPSLAMQTTANDAKVAAESVDSKLTSGLTSRINRLPDINAGSAGGLSLVGSEMTLDSATLAALFSDTDTAALVDAIIARVEDDLDGADLSVAAIAVAVRNEILNRLLAGNHDTDGSVGAFLQRLDAAVTSRLASGSYTAPDNAGISAAAASAATAASQATTAATQASTAATQATTAATQSTTVANRLGAWTGSGINTVLGAIRAIAAKTAGLTPTDLSDGTTFNNVTDSLEAAAETGGSLTPEQQAQLDLIESKVATLTAGRRPQVVSPVSEGGELVLIAGADYLASADSVISLDIDDVGGAIRTYLQGADVDSVQLSVARAQDVNTVIGTIDPDEIQYASDVTTIQIEIDGDDTVNVYPAEDYEYHILAITNDAKEVVKVTGNCCIRRQRGTASS